MVASSSSPPAGSCILLPFDGIPSTMGHLETAVMPECSPGIPRDRASSYRETSEAIHVSLAGKGVAVAVTSSPPKVSCILLPFDCIPSTTDCLGMVEMPGCSVGILRDGVSSYRETSEAIRIPTAEEESTAPSLLMSSASQEIARRSPRKTRRRLCLSPERVAAVVVAVAAWTREVDSRAISSRLPPPLRVSASSSLLFHVSVA